MRTRFKITPQEMAQNGDLKGLLHLFRERPEMFDLQWRVKLLRIAMNATATKDFDAYMRLLYEHMIHFTGDLLIINQAAAGRMVDRTAETLNRHEDSSVKDVVNQVLHTIEKLHHHLITLTKAYATTSHTQKLGRLEKSPPTDRAAVLKLVRETEALADTKEASHG